MNTSFKEILLMNKFGFLKSLEKTMSPWEVIWEEKENEIIIGIRPISVNKANNVNEVEILK